MTYYKEQLLSPLSSINGLLKTTRYDDNKGNSQHTNEAFKTGRQKIVYRTQMKTLFIYFH